MTVVHLVRHGQTDWNVERRVQGHTESRLTLEGQEQARARARQLREVPFDRAYASSSIRARDTARYILEHHEGVDLELRDDLRELYLGPWEGQLYADVKRREPQVYGYFWEDPSRFSLAGAETFHKLQVRAATAVDEIIATNSGQTLLLVSHGAFIKALLCYYERRHLSRFWHPPRMTNCCHSIIRQNGAGKIEIEQYAGLREW